MVYILCSSFKVGLKYLKPGQIWRKAVNRYCLTHFENKLKRTAKEKIHLTMNVWDSAGRVTDVQYLNINRFISVLFQNVREQQQCDKEKYRHKHNILQAILFLSQMAEHVWVMHDQIALVFHIHIGRAWVVKTNNINNPLVPWTNCVPNIARPATSLLRKKVGLIPIYAWYIFFSLKKPSSPPGTHEYDPKRHNGSKINERVGAGHRWLSTVGFIMVRQLAVTCPKDSEITASSLLLRL